MAVHCYKVMSLNTKEHPIHMKWCTTKNVRVLGPVLAASMGGARPREGFGEKSLCTRPLPIGFIRSLMKHLSWTSPLFRILTAWRTLYARTVYRGDSPDMAYLRCISLMMSPRPLLRCQQCWTPHFYQGFRHNFSTYTMICSLLSKQQFLLSMINKSIKNLT